VLEILQADAPGIHNEKGLSRRKHKASPQQWGISSVHQAGPLQGQEPSENNANNGIQKE
jgi:hypothetical protein